MTSHIEVVGNQVIVQLNGSIYVEEATAIREQLLEYIEQGHVEFVINLGSVDYIDSSGLGVLVAIQKRALQKNGRVIIRDLRGLVRELFELTRLTSVFEIEG